MTGRLCDRSTPTYAGGSFDAGSQTNDVFHGLHHRSMGSASSRVTSGDGVHDACSGFTTRCGPVTCSTPLRRCGLSTDAGSFATRDLGLSPDRTCTGKPSCPYGPVASSQILPCHGARASGRTPRNSGAGRAADRQRLLRPARHRPAAGGPCEALTSRSGSAKSASISRRTRSAAVSLCFDTGVLLIELEALSGTYARVAVTPRMGRHQGARPRSTSPSQPDWRSRAPK